MPARYLGWLPLMALCAGCTHSPEPKVAVADPRVVVDVGGAGEDDDDGELRPIDPEDEAKKKRAIDREIAQKAGILGVLQATEPGESVFGSSGLDADLDSALGGLTGNSVGDAHGAGGLGLSGIGRGGGGTGEGIGLGRVGTIGRGGGGGGTGYGSRGGRLGGPQHASPPRVTTAKPKVTGSLDKEIIQRIIRRHISQVRYCYERQLTKDPNIAGRLEIKFTIGKDGRVTTAKVEEALEASVDSCVAGVFRRMTFPKPKGGGIVIVSYPLVFKAGSSTPASPAKVSPKPSPPSKAATPKKPARK